MGYSNPGHFFKKSPILAVKYSPETEQASAWHMVSFYEGDDNVTLYFKSLDDVQSLRTAITSYIIDRRNLEGANAEDADRTEEARSAAG